PPGWTGKLEQAWFPGVHCNVGGGYSPDGLANEALHWIVEKAEALGLEFDSAYLNHFTPCFNSVLQNSMTATYRTLGEPRRQPRHERQRRAGRRELPHPCDGRGPARPTAAQRRDAACSPESRQSWERGGMTGTIQIRGYVVGFGDCILLRLPDGG